MAPRCRLVRRSEDVRCRGLVPTPQRLARYIRPDHLHSAFNFDFLMTPWRAPLLRASIDDALVALAAVSAEPTWVLSNHDVVRVVSRLGVPQPNERKWQEIELDAIAEPDLDLGTRRARRGTPDARTARRCLHLPGRGARALGGPGPAGRGACRSHLGTLRTRAARSRWRARPAPMGCGRPVVRVRTGQWRATWLPQPVAFAAMAAERQAGDPASMLELYRSALRIRREHPGLGSGPMRWRDAPKGFWRSSAAAGSCLSRTWRERRASCRAIGRCCLPAVRWRVPDSHRTPRSGCRPDRAG